VAITLAPLAVRPRLQGRFGAPLYLYAERCASTQDLLPLDAPEGALALAEEQTRGRGRRGRDWQGAAGKGLLFSLCLRPQVETARLASFTPVAAEAIAQAVASFGGQATVKPPNDVLLGGKKIAGILAEASAGRVALGVGVNVEQKADELPERPVFPASSLALELGRSVDRIDLLVCILAQLERHYDLWLAETAV